MRASGLATEQDEAVLGESSLAGPVFDSYGEAVGAIGVVIPSNGDVSQHEARDAVRESRPGGVPRAGRALLAPAPLSRLR